MSAKLSAEFEAVVERGHTGRCSASDQLDKLAQVWCEHPEESHEGAQLFVKMLNSFPRMHNGPVVCFRGRRGDNKKIIGWENMGPPLNGSKKGGRYDEPGSIVLYVCSRKNAVAREKPDNGILWIQEYALPTDTLTILDARPTQNRQAGFIDSVFDLTESSCLEGRKGRTDFKFSQLIARLVARAGFDGFNVPGVRGERGFWYSNIVIFKPGEAWRDWSRREAGFERQHDG